MPDHRGLFHRGWDHGKGFDKGAKDRIDRGDGLGGDFIGTVQADSTSLP